MQKEKSDLMITVKDVPAGKLIPALAEELKKFGNIKMPESIRYVKSGVSSERPPTQPDFWYLRAAAILRRIYISGPVGAQRLRTVFGTKRRRGHKPGHHRKAGGKIIRTMLQQLEAEGLIEKTEKPKKGRIVSPKGRKFLDHFTKGMK